MNTKIIFSLAIGIFFCHSPAFAQVENGVSLTVQFNKPLQEWDGFGVNYVETSQTTDYTRDPQDYGGFSILSQDSKEQILDSIFGDQGLGITILKMFLDPWHKAGPSAPYSHLTTTKNMRYVATGAKKRINNRNHKLTILTTLYGPPALFTINNSLRGKYLNKKYIDDLADYMIDWVQFLKEENLPVNYLSLHNEGEDWMRMPVDGGSENITHQHLDYNLFWDPDQTVKFLRLLRPKLDEAGLKNVLLTPGEYTNWYRFNSMGYARSIANDSLALNNLGLITSHGFYNGQFSRLFSGTTNHGSWLLQSMRPDLHAWTTSMSWMNSTIEFANQLYYHIYLARVNAIIPWAFIQRPETWANGDPNPGNAVTVMEDSTFRFTRGYYFYKQFTQAGRPGTFVTTTTSMDPSVSVLGFKGNHDPNAFIIINNGYSFPNITDALIINFKINGVKKELVFAHKEPFRNNQLPDGVSYKTLETTNGYDVEAAIPLGSFSANRLDDMLVNFIVRSGAEDLENQIGWLGERDSYEKIIPSATSNPPVVDGIEDELWNAPPGLVVNKQLLEQGRFLTTAEIRLLKDNEYLYVFASIHDETNSKNKPLNIRITGSDYTAFNAYRTSYAGENYQFVGTYQTDEHGILTYDSPSHSVTTFIGVR